MLGPLGMSEVLRPDHSHSKDHGYLGKGLSKYLLQDQVAQTRLIHFSECPAPWGFTKIGTWVCFVTALFLRPPKVFVGGPELLVLRGPFPSCCQGSRCRRNPRFLLDAYSGLQACSMNRVWVLSAREVSAFQHNRHW